MLLNTKEIAKYLGLEPVTVRRKALRGEIPAIKVGNRFRFDKDEIDRWIQNNTTGIKKSFLVIDDEPTIGNLIKRILAEQGNSVTVTQSSIEALSFINQQEYDLIFLDLVMPDLDGSEVIKHIKEKDEQAKVVIITGYPDGELMMRAMEYGPLLVLKKPFTADDILQAVGGFAKSTHI